MIDRRCALKGAMAAGVASLVPMASAARASIAPLKVGSVKFGSLAWVLETIKAEGIDGRLGLTILPVELANNQAGPISLLSGGSDIIMSDWPWALRQRGLGEALKFAPFSSTLGGVVVPAGSPVKSLTDLKGKRLGVAGSGIDKSWLLLQAYARRKFNFDLASKATIQYGAAPLLTEQMRSGSLDAMLNFWTQNVRLPAGDFREVVALKDVITGLGVDPIPALVGFIWKEPLEQANPGAVALFLKAVAEANAILASTDAVWDRLKPLVKSQNDAEFAAIRQVYRSGISAPWRDADMKSAETLLQLLVTAGDQELIGAKTKFDPKLFHVASS